MSLWAKSQQLPPDVFQKIRSAYGTQFPIEVRHFLSHWIEQKIWANVHLDHDQNYVPSLIESLFQEIERKASTFNESAELFVFKLQLCEAAKNLRLKYGSNPMELYRIIHQCLATEYSLVTENDVEKNSTLSIESELEVLQIWTKETADELKTMVNDEMSFTIFIQEYTKVKLQVQKSMEKSSRPDAHIAATAESLARQINVKRSSLLHQSLNLVNKLKFTVFKLELLQFRVIHKELERSKNNQMQVGNGATFVNNFDAIQVLCEGLAELIWLTRQQAKRVEQLKRAQELHEPPGVEDHLPHVMNRLNSLLTELVSSTFVIEKQPQIVKINGPFSTSIRLLVGGKLNADPPQVIVTLIRKPPAGILINGDWMHEVAGEILNGTGRMEYHQCTDKLILNLNDMQLERDTESVTDEKFVLFFRSQITLDELVFSIWTVSAPIVVIVHDNQESDAWATITWDSALSNLGQAPFNITKEVPWSRVAEVLDTKFKSATGRSLTKENLDFLAAKALRINPDHAPNQDYSSQILAWSAFAKDNLPERNFTFWEWFYSLLKLTRDHLQGPWKDGRIIGLVTRKQTEEMLADCSPGTFLIRFSESELGGIGIAWVDQCLAVRHMQPFKSEDFSVKTLADWISDFEQLTQLYPDVPKERAFAK